jgi:hypothetical protein
MSAPCAWRRIIPTLVRILTTVASSQHRQIPLNNNISAVRHQQDVQKFQPGKIEQDGSPRHPSRLVGISRLQNPTRTTRPRRQSLTPGLRHPASARAHAASPPPPPSDRAAGGPGGGPGRSGPAPRRRALSRCRAPRIGGTQGGQHADVGMPDRAIDSPTFGQAGDQPTSCFRLVPFHVHGVLLPCPMTGSRLAGATVRRHGDWSGFVLFNGKPDRHDHGSDRQAQARQATQGRGGVKQYRTAEGLYRTPEDHHRPAITRYRRAGLCPQGRPGRPSGGP